MPVPAKPRPTVYYIRHGETDWNVGGRLQGRRDVPLNARGRTQAAHCGEVLRDLFVRDGRNPAKLDYVSSPLGRATETMELARPVLGLPAAGFRTEPRLAEIAFGLSAAKKDLATAVQFAASLDAQLPVTATALACYEAAEAAGLGDADATAVSVRWAHHPDPAAKS